MGSERSQSQKATYFIIPFIWNVSNRQIHIEKVDKWFFRAEDGSRRWGELASEMGGIMGSDRYRGSFWVIKYPKIQLWWWFWDSLNILKTIEWFVCLFVCLFVLPYPMACGTLVPWPGIETTPPALEGTVLTTGPQIAWYGLVSQ